MQYYKKKDTIVYYYLDKSSRSVIIGDTPLGGAALYYIALRGLQPQVPYIVSAAEVTPSGTK